MEPSPRTTRSCTTATRSCGRSPFLRRDDVARMAGHLRRGHGRQSHSNPQRLPDPPRHPRPLGVPLATMLEAQVPFTLYHLLSSLIFVPLFGTAFLFMHAYGWPTRSPEETPSKPLGRG